MERNQTYSSGTGTITWFAKQDVLSYSRIS